LVPVGIEDCAYWPIEFKEVGKFEVVCAGFQSPKWEVMPFAINQEIRKIAAVETALIFYSHKKVKPKIAGCKQMAYEFYKIPLR
jgi:hypothetical protein